MPALSPEATVVRNYLETLLELPWKKRSRDRIDTRKVRERLDTDHYGLEKVKDRIVEFLSVYKLTHKLQGTILCLVGPPGVGKTSLGRSIADSMNRKFVRISLGGVRDEAEIRGPPAHLHRQQARAASSSRCARRAPRTRSSCSTRSTRWAPTSAAIRRRRCSRCSIPSRTAISATTTSRWTSTSARSCSSPRPTACTRSRRPSRTAWRSSACRDTSSTRS